MKNEKLEVQGGQSGLLPIFGPLSLQRILYCDRVFLDLCHDRVFRVATGFLGQVHDPVWVCATNVLTRVTAQRARTIEPSGFLSRQESPCCDMVPRHAGRFGSRQRLSLSRYRFVGLVSRQNFSVATGLRQARSSCVVT